MLHMLEAAQRSLGKTRTRKIMCGIMQVMPTYERFHWKKFFGVKPIFCSTKRFDTNFFAIF